MKMEMTNDGVMVSLAWQGCYPPPLCGGGCEFSGRENSRGVATIARVDSTPPPSEMATPPRRAAGGKESPKASSGKGRVSAEVARGLRQRATDAENRLWLHLQNRRLGGFKFRRQHPVGRYVADFACVSARLIVEADGGRHGDIVDAERDDYLRAQGWRVLRFWNNDILCKRDDVLSAILSAAQLNKGENDDG